MLMVEIRGDGVIDDKRLLIAADETRQDIYKVGQRGCFFLINTNLAFTIVVLAQPFKRTLIIKRASSDYDGEEDDYAEVTEGWS